MLLAPCQQSAYGEQVSFVCHSMQCPNPSSHDYMRGEAGKTFTLKLQLALSGWWGLWSWLYTGIMDPWWCVTVYI